MKIEQIALAVLGIVFLIAIFQAIQLTALNEKVSSQEKLTKLVLGQTPLASGTGSQSQTVQSSTQTAPSAPRQVGGC